LLARLRSPASAAVLSEEFAMPRQKIGYHLRMLEKAGLVAEAGTRRRRGFTERMLETRSDALIVDPMILAPADPDAVGKQDRFARRASRPRRGADRPRRLADARGGRIRGQKAADLYRRG
jgi:DNA-binding transcriptional ArsR family regulator